MKRISLGTLGVAVSMFSVWAIDVVQCVDETDKKPVNVFLFAGQSNMAGADSNLAEPPGFQSTPADRAAKFTASPLPKSAKGDGYTPWGEMRGHRLAPGGKLVQGPEVGFARKLYDAGWREVAVIKVYANFSRDAKTWPWGPGGDFFQQWTKFTDDRLAELKAAGQTYRVRGFVWHQGIDDAIHGKLANMYQQNLTELIAALRKRYADDNAPFVLARSVNSPLAPKESMAVVRRAQAAVGESVGNCAWINVDDLPNVNYHHFSAASQLTLGQRFGEAFLKLPGR